MQLLYKQVFPNSGPPTERTGVGKFPPKHRQKGDWKHLVPKDDADTDDGMSMMKRMLELITIYRPDWVDKTFPSSKYHVLCEEITKELTNRFNRLKC